MQISNYIQNAALLYPLSALTILASSTILDLRVVASDVFSSIVIDLIRTQPKKLYISILAKSADNNVLIKKYFLCTLLHKIIKALSLYLVNAGNYVLDCYIIVNKLPELDAYQKDPVELDKTVITKVSGVTPIVNLDFQGLISVLHAPDGFPSLQNKSDLRYIVSRASNPGYQLSASSMANFLNRLIKRVNMLSVPRDLTLTLKFKLGIKYKVLGLNNKVITLYLDTDVDTLGCDD